MKTYTRLRAVVNLDAIRHNIEAIRENIADNSKIIAVVKTDAYGHGAVPIAKELEQLDYIWGYAVAFADEGYLLRKAGLKKPILCLGCVFEEQMELLIKSEMRITVSSYEWAQKASKIAERIGKKAYLHIKIDTGMSRIGFLVNEQNVEEILKIAKLPGLVLEGLHTHFAKADEAEKEDTLKQLQAYLWMKEKLQEAGLTFPYYHTANSAAIIDIPQSNMDLVRAGIAMYGLYPSDEVNKEAVELWPAMELKTHTTHVKWIEAGTKVSYGGTFTTKRRTKVATVPAGYGDGYPRSLSNKGYVLVHGQKAPIIGRICMDQFMIDVTDIPDVESGTEITLFGRDGDAFLSLEELAVLSERFNYEFLCNINKRVPREYISGGKVISQVDYF